MDSRVKLGANERLELAKRESKGPWNETDIFTYHILDSSNRIVGSVVHTDHTSQNGLRRTQSLVQRDAHGNVVLEADW